jgi:GT2 family glycosyltransferase
MSDQSAPQKGEGDFRLPSISIIMPVRNEENYIRESLATVLAQEYPRELLEVLIADGMSTDGTRAIIQEIQTDFPNIRLIDNPERIVPTALNRAIREAKGEIIVRMDGHALFAPDFLREDVRVLSEHPEAWSVGGPIVHTGRTPFGKAVATAMSHPLGVGNAAHRFADYEGYAEGAAFPALRKWIFDKVGLFDERLVRNQDDEFNFRITQAGGRIYITPRVRYWYYVRETPSRLFQQYFQYAFWRIPVMVKHRRPTTLRQLLPPLFFLLMGGMLIAGAVLANPLIAFGLPICYLLGLLVSGATLVPSVGAGVAVRVPMAMALMHTAYACGLLYGIGARLFRARVWDPGGQMARISR